MFIALNHATREGATSAITDAQINLVDPKQVFQAFVYKLGHVCDSIPGGDTVTSFTILRRGGSPGGVDYWFASNQRTHEELTTTATFIKTLLLTVGQDADTQVEKIVLQRNLLARILQFNYCRVVVYLRQLRAQAVECLDRCDPSSARDGKHNPFPFRCTESTYPRK